MNSRVHPAYKTRYRVSNWADYVRSLVQRGDITCLMTPGVSLRGRRKPRSGAKY